MGPAEAVIIGQLNQPGPQRLGWRRFLRIGPHLSVLPELGSIASPSPRRTRFASSGVMW